MVLGFRAAFPEAGCCPVYPRSPAPLAALAWEMVGFAMRGLIRRAAVVAGAVVVLLGLAVGVASATGAAAGPRLAAGTRALSGGTWGTAEEVPGTAALNRGGFAVITSVSCASAGNCSAGGFYVGPLGHSSQAFVVSQVHGTWGTAEEVPGTAALNRGAGAEIDSVSCASAGNCSAGGYYNDRSPQLRAFVVSQVHGTWGRAEEVPGTTTLNGFLGVLSVSCASAGNCSAGGFYQGSSGYRQAFVVSQVHGTWGTAKPGIRAGGGAETNSVSCTSAGNCSAGGSYTGRSGRLLAFVVSQVHGTWGTAEEVPGTAALDLAVESSRCRARRRATAAQAGPTTTGPATARRSWSARSTAPGARRRKSPAPPPSTRHRRDPLGVVRHGGQLQRSRDLHRQLRPLPGVRGQPGPRHLGHGGGSPGTATLNKGGRAEISSVSCASAGNCSAGGFYVGQLRRRPGVRGQPDRRHLGPGGGSPRHRHPQQGRRRRDQLGVVRHGGPLQRGRGLPKQLRPHPGVRGQPDLNLILIVYRGTPPVPALARRWGMRTDHLPGPGGALSG